MVNQYPHTLKFDLVTGSTLTTDDNGDIVITPGTTAVIKVSCRFEPNYKGDTIITNDGKAIIYNWVIYMPLGQVEIPNKMDVIGYMENGSVKGKGVVERFDKGQLNARAWV